jgi:transposase
LAQRLLADGEHVVDVPARLAARVRIDTGHGRKTDAHDALSVAVAAVRAKDLRALAHDPELEVLRMLTDRRDEVVRQRAQTVNRLQRLLAELTPGKARKDITALHARRFSPRCALETWLANPPPARGRAARRPLRGREEDQVPQ